MKNLILIFTLLGTLYLSADTAPKTYDTLKGKIFFSNQPFTNSNTGSKKTFTSADYIYGRMELTDETIDKAFRVTENQGTQQDGHLLYRVYIL